MDMTTGLLAQCDMNNCRETMEGPSSNKVEASLNTLMTDNVPITVITPCSLTSRMISEKLIVECVRLTSPGLALP